MKILNGLVVAALVLLPKGGEARPMIYSDEEMTRRAAAIAHVHISTSSQPGELPAAAVIKIIKGALPPEFRLSETNTMECGRRISPGEHLVFVVRKDGRFEPANCGRAWLPIEKGKVSWFRDLRAGKKGRTVSLEEALKDIQSPAAPR